MLITHKPRVFILLLLTLCAPASFAGSKTSGDFRVRYEAVNTDLANAQDAAALTLRSRLGVETSPEGVLNALLEFEDTRVLGGVNQYSPARHEYTEILDPEQTEVNQTYLQFKASAALDVKMGRQRIVLDNERFIGASGFRQNEQTFDAVSACYGGIADWQFYYAYLDKVHGIANVPPVFNFSFDSNDHLVNIAFSGLPEQKITAYAYRLKNQDNNLEQINPGLHFGSINTYGMRFEGEKTLAYPALIFTYTLEAATQEFAATSAQKYETHYSWLETGLARHYALGTTSLKAGQEVLGSDQAQKGFQTPYASKGAFLGGTDMFLETPASGLVRRFISLGGELMPLKLKYATAFNHYEQQQGAHAFGIGWSLLLIKPLATGWDIGISYAHYQPKKDLAFISGHRPNTETEKCLVWSEYKF